MSAIAAKVRKGMSLAKVAELKAIEAAKLAEAKIEAEEKALSRETLLANRLNHIREIRRQPNYGRADRGWVRLVIEEIYTMGLVG